MTPLRQDIGRHAATVKRHFWNAFIPHEGNDHRPHALRHKALGAYAIAIILVKVIVSGALFWYPGLSATSNLTSQNVVQLTNQARAQNKTGNLISNAKLAMAAQHKAQDMLSKGYFAHVSPQNVTPWYWLKQAGYSYSSAGENLAMDFLTAEDVTQAWLASPSHRKNLLNAKYKDIGVAVVAGKLKGVSTTIVVQFFGAPIAPVEQPKQVAKVTPPKPSTPSKPSSVAVEKPVQQPVLGEEIVAPATPIITSPNPNVILATARPWIGGESQPGVTIQIIRDGTVIGTTGSDANGYYQLQPNADLADGVTELHAVAVENGLTSPASGSLQVTVDTQPPSTSLQSAMILPSYLTPGAYVVTGTIVGNDIAQANVRLGSVVKPLPSTQGTFAVEIAPAAGDAAETIVLDARDAVGNASTVAIASLPFLGDEILQPSQHGIVSLIPKLIFFSRKFFLTFWLFLFLALAVSVIVKIRVQHRPMILYSLLLLYGLTILMIV